MRHGTNRKRAFNPFPPLWARRCAPLVWMALIFWLSSQPHLPSAPEPWLDLLLKKLAHAGMYAVLAALWWQALLTTPMNSASAAFLAVAISAVYGASDELHQYFVPGRNARLTDVLIDALGATAAMMTRRHWTSFLCRGRMFRPHHPSTQR